MKQHTSNTGKAIVAALGATALMSTVAVGVALGLAGATSLERLAPLRAEPSAAAEAVQRNIEPKPAARSKPSSRAAPAPKPAEPRAAYSGSTPVDAQKKPAPAADSEEQIVYVTRTGEKYHRGGCRYLARSRIPTTLSAARRGYGPCSVCRPPQ